MGSVRFALNPAYLAGHDLATAAGKIKGWGYDGVELVADSVPAGGVANARSVLTGAGLPVACVATAIAFPDDAKRNPTVADEVRRAVDLAVALGASVVRLLDVNVTGKSWERAQIAISDWLAPLGDYATGAGVTLAVANALSFRTARDLWTPLDRVDRPGLGVAWDVLNAALAGEGPAVSVPMLNSRIRYATVRDALLGERPPRLTPIGEGTVPLRQFLIRLRGIGYRGFVAVGSTAVDSADPETHFPAYLTKLRAWATEGAGKPEGPKGAPRAAATKKHTSATVQS